MLYKWNRQLQRYFTTQHILGKNKIHSVLKLRSLFCCFFEEKFNVVSKLSTYKIRKELLLLLK